MSIPSDEQCRLPILKMLGDNKIWHISDIFDYLDIEFEFSDEDKAQQFATGVSKLKNRIGWALTHLKNACLIESPKRTYYKITEQGHEVLRRNLSIISKGILLQYAPPDSPFFYPQKNNKKKVDNGKNFNDISILSEKQFMLPILKMMGDNKERHRLAIYDYLDEKFQFSYQDKAQRLTSGGSKLKKSLSNALNYLKDTNLLENTVQDYYKITEQGHEVLRRNLSIISKEDLSRYISTDNTPTSNDMDIPLVKQFMLPILKVMGDNTEHYRQDIFDYLNEEFQFSNEDKTQQLANNNYELESRMVWALIHLKKAGLIENPQKEYYKITEQGQNALKENLNVTNKQFPYLNERQDPSQASLEPTQFMLPILKAMGDNTKRHRQDIFDYLDEEFQFSDEDKTQQLASGGSKLENCMVWALVHLKKAGLLENPQRGYYKITEQGRNLLRENPSTISREILLQYAPPDSPFFYPQKNNKERIDNTQSSFQTPLELTEQHYQLLKDHLANQLLKNIKDKAPYSSEKLASNLLLDLLLLDPASVGTERTGTQDTASKQTQKLQKGPIIHKTFNEIFNQIDNDLRNLYLVVAYFIENLSDDVQKKECKYYVTFKRFKHFACIEIKPQKKCLLIYLSLSPNEINLNNNLVRDVRGIGHWGTGDLEVTINEYSDFEQIKHLIVKSYEAN